VLIHTEQEYTQLLDTIENIKKIQTTLSNAQDTQYKALQTVIDSMKRDVATYKLFLANATEVGCFVEKVVAEVKNKTYKVKMGFPQGYTVGPYLMIEREYHICIDPELSKLTDYIVEEVKACLI
jgi:cobalamin biosynthesis Co2+ chelatase CbiK